jgi:hypothetical protein
VHVDVNVDVCLCVCMLCAPGASFLLHCVTRTLRQSLDQHAVRFKLARGCTPDNIMVQFEVPGVPEHRPNLKYGDGA